MKTNPTLDEAMKTVGRPLARLLEMSENIVARRQTSAPGKRAGAAREVHEPVPVAIQEFPTTLSDAIGYRTDRAHFSDQETHPETVIRGDAKMVLIPAFTKRKAAAESPRLDLARIYLATERRKEDALENLVFILLWVSSLFALGYCLSV